MRAGLTTLELKSLLREVDRYSAYHGVSRRQSLEWIGAA